MAEIDPVLAVAKLVDELQKAGVPPSSQDWNHLAERIARVFDSRREEVAILRLSGDADFLTFVVPLKLSVIGALPLTTLNSLAAKTIRSKRGELVNNFTAYKHPTVFEAVDLSKEEKAAPIQKIMSSPMMVDGKVVGVIQISRKAHPGVPVGPDFTHADLEQLNSIGPVLGKFLSELPAPATMPSKRSGQE